MTVDREHLLADIADDVHTARVHGGQVCHGDNDGCEGGPDAVDNEGADVIYDRVEPTLDAYDTLLRVVTALADVFVDGACSLVAEAEPGGRWRGRCPNLAVAARWEHGYLDEVCELHAESARARGALVITPRRADGTTK